MAAQPLVAGRLRGCGRRDERVIGWGGGRAHR
jgi:hypothetical protein